MAKPNTNTNTNTNTQPQAQATQQQATQPATTTTKPQAVALQRTAGQAGAKNGAVAAAWGIYNANPAATRSAAVKLAIAAGINPATAATQYQQWYKAAKLAAAAQAQPAAQ